jgi:HPt (histidine-containing phosphotransfer) domain-containing protein
MLPVTPQASARPVTAEFPAPSGLPAPVPVAPPTYPKGPASPPPEEAAPLFDLEGALERVAGHSALLRSVVGSFLNGRDTWSAIFAPDVDPKERAQVAHALKGVAGNLGAVALSRLAGDAETRSRAGEPLSQTALTALERTWAETRAIMRDWHEKPDPKAPAAAPIGDSRPVEDAELARLREMLEGFDAEAERFVLDRRAGFEARLGAAPVAALLAAVSGFDFDAALGALGPP